MAALDFDPTEAEPSRGEYQVVPSDKYLIHAVQITENLTKSQTGKKLDFQFEIMDGEFAGATLFDSFNTHNPSEVAQRIGREQLSAYCGHAVPGVHIADTDQLLGKPIVASVRFIPVGFVRKGKGGTPDYTYEKDANEITGYAAAAVQTTRHTAPATRQEPVQMRQPTPTPVAVAAAAGTKPDWRTQRRVA